MPRVEVPASVPFGAERFARRAARRRLPPRWRVREPASEARGRRSGRSCRRMSCREPRTACHRLALRSLRAPRLQRPVNCRPRLSVSGSRPEDQGRSAATAPSAQMSAPKAAGSDDRGRIRGGELSAYRNLFVERSRCETIRRQRRRRPRAFPRRRFCKPLARGMRNPLDLRHP